MIWKILGGVFVLAFGAAYFSAIIPDSLPFRHKQMLAEISDQMRDPPSTQFRKLTFAGADGRDAVCGEINAKNGMGGYSGFYPFVFVSPSTLKVAPGDPFITAADLKTSATNCARSIVLRYQEGFANDIGKTAECISDDETKTKVQAEIDFFDMQKRYCRK